LGCNSCSVELEYSRVELETCLIDLQLFRFIQPNQFLAHRSSKEDRSNENLYPF
jgi:hypothetical protein